MFIEHGEDRTCAERDNRSEAHASPFPLLHIFLNFSPSRTLLALRFAAPVLRHFTILLTTRFLMCREKCVESRDDIDGPGKASRRATKGLLEG